MAWSSKTRDHNQYAQPDRRTHRSCGFVGLRNRGATCYLNSLLQTLLLTPEFRDKIFLMGDTEAQIPRELQRLFARMLLVNRPEVDTNDFTRSLGWAHRQQWIQQDVHELNRTLFSALEDALTGTSGTNIINEVYKGVIVHEIECDSCKYTEINEEDFLDITAAVKGRNSLQDSLNWKFHDYEHLEGSNAYPCQNCKTKTTSRKSARIRALPPILTICLLRYEMGYWGRRKLNSWFEFPELLDMSPYLAEAGNKETAREKYELLSVIIHSGTAHGGHYHAYIKDIDELGKCQMKQEMVHSKYQDKAYCPAGSSHMDRYGASSQRWFDFDDSSVRQISSSAIEKQFGGLSSECAYMLFYRRKEQRHLNAKGNRSYLVPKSLVMEMNETNNYWTVVSTSRSQGDTRRQPYPIEIPMEVIADHSERETMEITTQAMNRPGQFNRRSLEDFKEIFERVQGNSIKIVIRKVRSTPTSYHQRITSSMLDPQYWDDLGSLEVDLDSTLEILKVQVYSLEPFYEVTSIHCLRLQLLVNGKTEICKGLQNKLRSLGIHEGTEIFVQVTDEDKDLSMTEILCEVRFWDKESYGDPFFIHWSTQNGDSSSLKSCIENQLQSNLGKFAIAKYFPERSEWVALPKKDSKGKRKNLREHPFYLQDGDLIGCKLVTNKKGKVKSQDFFTEVDKRYQRNEKRNPYEVGL